MRKIKLIGFLCALALLAPCGVIAQTVPVSAVSLQDGSSLACATGSGQTGCTINWAPVLSAGTPTVYRKPGGGMATVTPVSKSVVNGAFTLSSMPDSALTIPVNLCWRVTLNTPNGSSLLGACVQPSASNYWYSGGVDNFDNWFPTIPPQPTLAYVQSVNGCTGVCSGYLTVSALSPYALISSLGSAAFQPSSAFDASGAAAAAQAAAEAASDPAGAASAAQAAAVALIPSASSTTPSMDGAGASGSGTTWARADHVHPTDTSRQSAIVATGVLKGTGSSVVQAVAGTDYVAPATAMNPNTPAWLQNLGSGADGANTNASGSIAGEKFYTNFTVPYGNTVTATSIAALTIHATGTCTIAGTINARGVDAVSSGNNAGGGSGGGSGGGAAAGTAGGAAPLAFGTGIGTSGGTAGALSGGNGANGSTAQATYQRAMANTGLGLDGLYMGGGIGRVGANSGGAAGNNGYGVTLICASIIGTDGTHTGIIDVSGQYGMPPSANSTGAGSAGGGGVVILSSQAAVSTWPTIYVAGGPGGLVTVPEAAATSGSCTSQPKATLGVSGGVLNSCTVVQAGAGCGTGTNVTFNILGGGGIGGSVTPTWSGGALASCTASGGSGYTAATYTTAGTGGDGGYGWFAEFQNW